jgi:hypothetical protein
MCEEMALQDMGGGGEGCPELAFSVRDSKVMSRRLNLVALGLDVLCFFFSGYLHSLLKSIKNCKDFHIGDLFSRVRTATKTLEWLHWYI